MSNDPNLWHELIEEIHDRIHEFNEVTYLGLQYYERIAQKQKERDIIDHFRSHYDTLMSTFLENLGEKI